MLYYTNYFSRSVCPDFEHMGCNCLCSFLPSSVQPQAKKNKKQKTNNAVANVALTFSFGTGAEAVSSHPFNEHALPRNSVTCANMCSCLETGF